MFWNILDTLCLFTENRFYFNDLLQKIPPPWKWKVKYFLRCRSFEKGPFWLLLNNMSLVINLTLANSFNYFYNPQSTINQITLDSRFDKSMFDCISKIIGTNWTRIIIIDFAFLWLNTQKYWFNTRKQINSNDYYFYSLNWMIFIRNC